MNIRSIVSLDDTNNQVFGTSRPSNLGPGKQLKVILFIVLNDLNLDIVQVIIYLDIVCITRIYLDIVHKDLSTSDLERATYSNVSQTLQLI